MTNNLAFDVTDLHYSYNDNAALQGVNLTIEKGQRVALLGANGSGKSTLMRLLDGLYFANSGRVSVFGEELSEHAMQDEETAFDFRRRVGFVFQSPDVQLFCPTVFDEVAFGPLQLGWTKEEVLERVNASMKEFNIEHLKDRSPFRLSGGEKKRVALASILILNPEILLLDEPTAALDPKSASDVVDFLVDSKGTGRTVITATHDLDIVEDIADLCIVMQAGRVVATGLPSDILHDVDLLEQTHLTHSHRHANGGDHAHSHHHLHRGDGSHSGAHHSA